MDFWPQLAYRAKMGQNSLKMAVFGSKTHPKVPKTPLNQNISCLKYFFRTGKNFTFCDLGTYAACRGAKRAKKGDFHVLFGAKNPLFGPSTPIKLKIGEVTQKSGRPTFFGWVMRNFFILWNVLTRRFEKGGPPPPILELWSAFGGF